MTRRLMTLTIVLLACSGCGSSGQRVTVPFVRCHHVSEAAARGSGGEPVYLAAISQVVTGDGSGEASVRRFPQGNAYVFHTGNVVGRDFTDQSGGEQAPPVLWSGQLKAGERLLVLVRLATPASANGAASQSEPLPSALSGTINKESSLREDEKATLRHIGLDRQGHRRVRSSRVGDDWRLRRPRDGTFDVA